MAMDEIKWYEIHCFQRVWMAEVTNMDGRFGPYPKVWVGTSEEFGTMVSITDLELEMGDPVIWDYFISTIDRQMSEAITKWAGGSAVLLGPREWTCRPFMKSEWDYMVRKGLVEEQA